MSQTLSVLIDAGLNVSIKPDGKTLSVLPAAKLTPPLRSFIIKHKAEILAELQAANEAKKSAVIHFKLESGKGGVLIDPEGVASAVHSLLGIWGDRLDMLALVDTLQGMGYTAKLEADKLIQRASNKTQGSG